MLPARRGCARLVGATLVGLALLTSSSVPMQRAFAQEPEQVISLPPGERPVRVGVGMYLVDLLGVAERSETFNADIYLGFRWNDSRLAFSGDEQKRYLEEAAIAQLERMWWPQIELVNTSDPKITNRSLEIYPDGTVFYMLGVSAEFRTDLDLHRFPFDSQKLEVRIESFLWTESQMVFEIDRQLLGRVPKSTVEGVEVTDVSARVTRNHVEGWGGAFSQFVGRIDVIRRAGFYLWTVFGPVTLIFLISCTVFVVPIEGFHDRVGISLAALLACIATQFAMSFNLPQISYLTVIDRVFLAAYLCVALGVLISTIQAVLLGKHPDLMRRMDRWAGLGLPLLYFGLLLGAVMS